MSQENDYVNYLDIDGLNYVLWSRGQSFYYTYRDYFHRIPYGEIFHSKFDIYIPMLLWFIGQNPSYFEKE